LPIHPAIASNFHLLDGIDSFEAGLADPVTRARLDEFMSHRGAPRPGAVDVSPGRRPGRTAPCPSASTPE
jgi:acetyl esterase